MQSIKDMQKEAGEEAITLTPLLKMLLENRGITDEEAQSRFLHPSYTNDLHDPFLLKDMDRAVDRIVRALKDREKIIIYTDYDTDGIPAGVLLHDFFKKINYTNFQNYIPHRNNEGYGLNTNAVALFAKEGATLLITADCGITDIEEAAYAKGLGIDVIITDHHLPRRGEDARGSSQEVLPDAYAVVNPNRGDCAYPFKGLCGAGVAYKLVCALTERGREEGFVSYIIGWEKWLLDMVGIATIADMVPLTGENRALAYYGLDVLRKSPRPGLQSLLRLSKVSQRYLTEEDVGFSIGPRVNAASRIDTPSKAFELFAHREASFAGVLAEELHALNDRRKRIVASMLKEAKRKLKETELRDVLVLGNLNWHPGVVGLAANRLAEEHERPVFVWGGAGSGVLKGSCRSDGRVNIVYLMGKVGGLFASFGGHEYSGGFSVERKNVHLLEEALSSAYREIEKKEVEKEEWVDGVLTLDQIHESTYRDMERLAPFGIGNPRPVFLFENAEISRVDAFGAHANHVKMLCGSEAGHTVSAISFFTSAREVGEKSEANGNTLSFFANVEKNMFRGQGNIRLRIVKFL